MIKQTETTIDEELVRLAKIAKEERAKGEDLNSERTKLRKKLAGVLGGSRFE